MYSNYQPACAITLFKNNSTQNLPEYLNLDVLVLNERQVKQWLKSEIAAWPSKDCKKQLLDERMENQIEQDLSNVLYTDISPIIAKIIKCIINNPDSF
jgi:hypothetical protein